MNRPHRHLDATSRPCNPCRERPPVVAPRTVESMLPNLGLKSEAIACRCSATMHLGLFRQYSRKLSVWALAAHNYQTPKRLITAAYFFSSNVFFVTRSTGVSTSSTAALDFRSSSKPLRFQTRPNRSRDVASELSMVGFPIPAIEFGWIFQTTLPTRRDASRGPEPGIDTTAQQIIRVLSLYRPTPQGFSPQTC